MVRIGIVIALLALAGDGRAQIEPRYLVSDAMWQRLFASPNRNLSESAHAWETIARVVKRVVSRAPANSTSERLTVLMRLGPTGHARGDKWSVFTSVVPVYDTSKHGPLNALVAVAASAWLPDGRIASRHVSMLVTRIGTQWRTQLLTSSLPFGGGLTNGGEGRRNGRWITLVATDWHRRLAAGYGPAWACVLHLEGHRWKVVASRVTDDSATGQAVTGRGIPDAQVDRHSRRGKAIQHISEVPAMTYRERWTFSGGSLRTVDRRIVPNQYWAVDGLIEALRRKDLKAARRFITADSVIQDALAAGLDGGVGPWNVTEEGDQNETGLQAGYGNGEQFRAAGFRFTRIGGEERIRLIRNYRPMLKPSP